MKKNLQNDLKKIYTEVPIPNPINIQETIIKVRKEVNEAQDNGLTFWEFYFQQFGFIRKNVWLIQFAILLFCGLRIYYYPGSIKVISLISSIAPLIFLSGITELSRTYTYGTIEIELSTQYTLSQVMMSRVSILGLMDILSITILCVFVGTNTPLYPYAIFLYVCVPFMVTCFGCLWLLNRFKNKECNYYCFTLGIFIMVTVSMSTAFLPKLYVVSSLWIWSIMLLISIIGSGMQIFKLVNSCNKKYDYINVTHI
ncbi:hypothetical protein CHL78_017975 [Romboutsia weinsteinii]|uniref:ABC-2 transporter permease n=1 Tax=Romboutsia weinsteinii TaxID=2020949 RepID=A0A371IYE4_9FIRM|nr:hypothetical protein [Romboutsia weinsteinii]RDY25486.1 hypothetical protein CHL78_017975 [Romboutsia weinsteinii]